MNTKLVAQLNRLAKNCHTYKSLAEYEAAKAKRMPVNAETLALFENSLVQVEMVAKLLEID